MNFNVLLISVVRCYQLDDSLLWSIHGTSLTTHLYKSFLRVLINVNRDSDEREETETPIEEVSRYNSRFDLDELYLGGFDVPLFG